MRRLLFDVKTIHAGVEHYFSAHAAEEQSGAVRHREHTVWPDYLRHARELDRDHHPITAVVVSPQDTIGMRGMRGRGVGTAFR